MREWLCPVSTIAVTSPTTRLSRVPRNHRTVTLDLCHKSQTPGPRCHSHSLFHDVTAIRRQCLLAVSPLPPSPSAVDAPCPPSANTLQIPSALTSVHVSNPPSLHSTSPSSSPPFTLHRRRNLPPPPLQIPRCSPTSTRQKELQESAKRPQRGAPSRSHSLLLGLSPKRSRSSSERISSTRPSQTAQSTTRPSQTPRNRHHVYSMLPSHICHLLVCTSPLLFRLLPYNSPQETPSPLPQHLTDPGLSSPLTPSQARQSAFASTITAACPPRLIF